MASWMGGCCRNMAWFQKTARSDEESSWFVKNKTELLDRLLAASNGAYDIPYRFLTAKEVSKATNGNLTKSNHNFAVRTMFDGTGRYIRGSFQQTQVMVKKFHVSIITERPSYVINDMVVSLQMNNHNNALKVLGCCLDFEVPAIIYDNSSSNRLLHDILFDKSKDRSTLPWSNRLKIATEIASALAHLHTGFHTPIIHRDLSSKNVVVDQNGVARLLDFSLCMHLPSGESQVEDRVIGTKSAVDPDYATTGIITVKTDVYMFGIILLELLTGKGRFDFRRNDFSLDELCTNHAEKHQLNNLLDASIFGEERNIEKDHQLQTFLELALRCTQRKGEDRPNITDVETELNQITAS